MKEDQFRNKIYWFTFFYSVFVIWVHSYNSELFLGKSILANKIYRIEHFIGGTIGQIAVPGFFMISAYLFYRDFKWEKLEVKWQSRVRSVLLPFILWNAIYYLGYVIASRLPFLSNVVGKGRVPFQFFALVDAILHYTYNYAFWYLYQLILLILLAPILVIVLKKWYCGLLFLIFTLWGIQKGVVLPHLNLDALLYYATATFLALHKKKWVEDQWSKKTALKGLLILLGAVLIYIMWSKKQVAFVVLFRLLVPISLWMIVNEAWLYPAKEWMKQNFFLYATHFAFVRLINKTAAVIFPAYPWLPLMLYLLMPVLVVAISYWLGGVLRQKMPSIWTVLNGGR